jgi:hypothetical protein
MGFIRPRRRHCSRLHPLFIFLAGKYACRHDTRSRLAEDDVGAYLDVPGIRDLLYAASRDKRPRVVSPYIWEQISQG